MNSVQTKTLQQSQLLTLQTPKLENADDKSGWLVLAAIAALGSFVGLSALKHKQYMALRRNDDLQSNVPEEDTYFG